MLRRKKSIICTSALFCCCTSDNSSKSDSIWTLQRFAAKTLKKRKETNVNERYVNVMHFWGNHHTFFFLGKIFDEEDLLSYFIKKCFSKIKAWLFQEITWVFVVSCDPEETAAVWVVRLLLKLTGIKNKTTKMLLLNLVFYLLKKHNKNTCRQIDRGVDVVGVVSLLSCHFYFPSSLCAALQMSPSGSAAQKWVLICHIPAADPHDLSWRDLSFAAATLYASRTRARASERARSIRLKENIQSE